MAKMTTEQKAEMYGERLDKIHAIATAILSLIAGEDPVVYTLVDLIHEQSSITVEEME